MSYMWEGAGGQLIARSHSLLGGVCQVKRNFPFHTNTSLAGGSAAVRDRSLALSHSHTLSHTHTHTLLVSHTPAPYFSLPHTPYLSLTHTHPTSLSHTRTLPLSHTPYLSLSLTPYLSIPHPLPLMPRQVDRLYGWELILRPALISVPLHLYSQFTFVASLCLSQRARILDLSI